MSKYTVTPFHDGLSNMCVLYKKFNDCDQISQISGKINGEDIDIATYWDRVKNAVFVYANGPYVYITNGINSINTMDVLHAFGISFCEVNVVMQWDKVGEVIADNKILEMPISETPLSHIVIQHVLEK